MPNFCTSLHDGRFGDKVVKILHYFVISLTTLSFRKAFFRIWSQGRVRLIGMSVYLYFQEFARITVLVIVIIAIFPSPAHSYTHRSPPGLHQLINYKDGLSKCTLYKVSIDVIAEKHSKLWRGVLGNLGLVWRLDLALDLVVDTVNYRGHTKSQPGFVRNWPIRGQSKGQDRRLSLPPHYLLSMDCVTHGLWRCGLFELWGNCAVNCIVVEFRMSFRSDKSRLWALSTTKAV